MVSITLYVKDTVIVLKSGSESISKLPTLTLGKKLDNWDWIFSLRPSKLPVVICSKIKALKPEPNVGLRYLSGGLVRKKFIRLFLTASLVV